VRTAGDGAIVRYVGKLTQIVIDCRHPAPLARFWAAALDGFEVLPYDDDEIARLARLGLTPETDTCVIVVGPDLELGFRPHLDARPGRQRLLCDRHVRALVAASDPRLARPREDGFGRGARRHQRADRMVRLPL
jgi:hypothetical protein